MAAWQASLWVCLVLFKTAVAQSGPDKGSLHEVPEIPYTTTQASAMKPGDSRCEIGRGDWNGQVCCPRTCGECDGASCSSAPGGATACCKTNILAAGLSCNANQAPCIIEARLIPEGYNVANSVPAPPPPHPGYDGGDKATDKWQLPALAPVTPPQGALAAPALTPDNSCKNWEQYSSEQNRFDPAFTEGRLPTNAGAHAHSQYASPQIPISTRGACGTVYPREGDAQDGMFPPGRHGNQEGDKLQQLYYNTDIQPATYCFWGGQDTRTEYSINTVVQHSTQSAEYCIKTNRETIGWPDGTKTYNLYGVTSGLSTTADFSVPLPTSGWLNQEYGFKDGVRIARTSMAHSDYPHSSNDQSVHGANSGFIVHSGMKDQCHDATLRDSCKIKTECRLDSTNTFAIANHNQCTPCSMAQQCAPSSPLHQNTTQVPPSISSDHWNAGGNPGDPTQTYTLTNGAYLSWPQNGLGTLDSGGSQAPGRITSGDA